MSKLALTMAAQRIILFEIRRKFGAPLEKGNSAWIRCPMPKHGGADGTPSFKINLDPNNEKAPIGFGYCFGCGEKVHWNELAASFQMQHLTLLDVEVSERTEVANKLRRLRHNMEAPTLEAIAKMDFGANMLHEPSEQWRGVSTKLLKAVGAKQIVDRFSRTSMLLPVSVQNVLVGAIKAQFVKDENKKVPSYLNSTGEWAKTHGLFPYDTTRNCMKKWGVKKIVLGEGPRDSLNALRYKMPSLAILGVKNWTKKKRDHILSLDPDEIIIAMDGDRAGIAATNMLMDEFERYLPTYYIDVKKYTIRHKNDNIDLGEAPDDMVDELLDMVYD